MMGHHADLMFSHPADTAELAAARRFEMAHLRSHGRGSRTRSAAGCDASSSRRCSQVSLEHGMSAHCFEYRVCYFSKIMR